MRISDTIAISVLLTVLGWAAVGAFHYLSQPHLCLF